MYMVRHHLLDDYLPLSFTGHSQQDFLEPVCDYTCFILSVLI